MPSSNQKGADKKKVVLVVEDDAALVKAYQMKFTKEGAELWVAQDGKEALEFLERERVPNIVLLDLMLPGVSGFEVLQKMRAHERWNMVPVIVVSNLGQPQDMERARSLGAEQYLVKANVRIADVIETVKKFLV